MELKENIEDNEKSLNKDLKKNKEYSEHHIGSFSKTYSKKWKINSLIYQKYIYSNTIEEFKIDKSLISVYGEKVGFIYPSAFIRVNSLIDKPKIDMHNPNDNISKLFPYILQNIKMYGCNILTPEHISGFAPYSTPSNKSQEAHIPSRKPKFVKSNKIYEAKKDTVVDMIRKYPISRIDIIVGIMNTVNPIVAHQLFTTLTKFPLALPLIIQELSNPASYKCLIPWIINSIIKWESQPGQIIENNLFADKFKMIVTMRIGDAAKGKYGKSTILNQLFSTKNVFSSCEEPGANMGKPFTLFGCVEFVCLTQEIASHDLWESVLKNHYESGDNEIILLANVHGNALECKNQLSLLKDLASSFILFIMPENNANVSENFSKLEYLENESENLFYVAVDPEGSQECFEECFTLYTTKIADDLKIEKLRNVIKSCIKINGRNIEFNDLCSKKNINIAEIIKTDESEELINFITKHTCTKMRNIMSIQKYCNSHESSIKHWNKNDQLQELATIIKKILNLELSERVKAISHLETELRLISAKESSNIRNDYIIHSAALQKLIGTKNEDVLINQYKKLIDKDLNKINDMSLNLEHIFREVAKLYKIFKYSNPKENLFLNMAKSYAELLLAGNSLELIDGDSVTIYDEWLSSIFDHIYLLHPKLRVYVISILGLQSSGKSTLLNSLFGCKFSVNVGRCTRGLSMRILFLDQTMRSNLDIDAILLIDAEGFGGPDRQNVADTEKKDRLLSTFAIGVSHLTIVNILGEYMKDLTEIMQFAIFAITRLEKVEINPNLLIVKHLTEINTGKTSSEIQKISYALKKTINFAEEKDVKFSARNSECLNTLKESISNRQHFKQFRPYKNETSVHSSPSEEYHKDVIDLHKTIIEIIKQSKSKLDFKEWHQILDGIWYSVKKNNFMNFKDIVDLQGYLELEEYKSKVKESIYSSFNAHFEKLVENINVQTRLKNQELKRDDMLLILKDKLRYIPNNCPSECDYCKNSKDKINELYSIVEKKPSEHETKLFINDYLEKTRNFYYDDLTRILSATAFRQIDLKENIETIGRRFKLNNKEPITTLAYKPALQKSTLATVFLLDRLDRDQYYNLENAVEKVIEHVILENNQTHLILSLENEIEAMIADFEFKMKTRFKPTFISTLHDFAVQQLLIRTKEFR